MSEPVILPPQTFLGRRRGLLVSLLAGVLVVGALAVAATAYLTRLPSPEQADRAGLVRWLVVTDLRSEPHELQFRLLNRVEQELAAGIDLHGGLAQLSPDQRQRLAANVDRLGECWFLRAADAYLAAPESGRLALLDQQAERIRQLGIFEQLELIERGAAANNPSAATSPNAAATAPGEKPAAARAIDYFAALTHNVERVERWIGEAPAAQRQPLQTYFDALRSRMLWSHLQKWLF